MPKTILIVDDAVHIRVLLEQTLEDFEDVGVEVLSAGNGVQAWEIIQAKQPDLIILDVMMAELWRSTCSTVWERP
jgi:two-component system alkaline phosphatase synthesis response regulator PhoP